MGNIRVQQSRPRPRLQNARHRTQTTGNLRRQRRPRRHTHPDAPRSIPQRGHIRPSSPRGHPSLLGLAHWPRPDTHYGNAVPGAGNPLGGPSLNREELLFERPTELFASSPPEMRGHYRDEVRLMVSTVEENTHHVFTDLPELLEPGDLLVVNESATLPASLPAMSRLGDIRLNLSTRFAENLWLAEPRWSPAQPGPLPLQEQDILHIGEAKAILLKPYPGIPRLWFTRFDTPASFLMAKYGEPIHYGYAPAYPMNTYQTLFSRFPGSVEMPSAARPITSRVRDALFARGVG